MKPFRIYTAGPIAGCSYEGAVNWRNAIARELAGDGIAAYSPMRAKEFLLGTKKLGAIMDHYADPMTSTRGIVCRDHQDCVRADVLLVNFLGATQVSIGTCFELAWAFDRRIPIVLVAEPDNLHLKHPFVTETADFTVGSLEEGVRIVKHILLPGEPRGEYKPRTGTEE